MSSYLVPYLSPKYDVTQKLLLVIIPLSLASIKIIFKTKLIYHHACLQCKADNDVGKFNHWGQHFINAFLFQAGE